MRILHVITSLRAGGAEKLMVELLPCLKDKGFDVELLLFDGIETPFRRELEAKGIKVFDFGIGGSVYSPMRLMKLIPILKKYDIVHTHNTAPQLFAAIGSMLRSVNLCTTEHNTSNRRRAWKWFAPVDHWMYSRYRKIICISDKTEENLLASLKNFPTDTITVYNGILIEKYSKAQPAKEPALLPPDIIKIMMVAGFRYQKDHPTVIKALKLLPDNCHLFLVGDGERREEYEKLTAELSLGERIHFLGVRSDVPSLLKAADICIISSHWEGFGLAAVEAMAAGKPVIATDVPGLAEVVKGAGILVPPENPQSIAAEIHRLATDKRYYEDTVSAERARAEQYDISKMADGYARVYNSLDEAN